jgi:hypothetical protein
MFGMNTALARMRLPLCFLHMIVALCFIAQDVWSATPSGSQVNAAEKSAKKGNLHAAPWVFGKSADRNAAIWREGVRAQNLHKQATPQKSVDTDSAIERALDAAKSPESQKPLGISIKKEKTDWREPLPDDIARPDENVPRESRHVVRALADVKASENLSINVGPELILKDQQHQAGNTDRQPDSALGMGMGFKLDF